MTSQKQITNSEAIKYLLGDVKVGLICTGLGALATGAGMSSIIYTSIYASEPKDIGWFWPMIAIVGAIESLVATKVVYNRVKEYLSKPDEYMQKYHRNSIK